MSTSDVQRKYTLPMVVFLILWMMAMVSPESVLASTDVPTTLSGSVVWNREGSPYLVSHSTALWSGTLTVDPGVTVIFANGAHLQLMNTSLVAIGTATEPIVFTGSATSSWALDISGTPAGGTKGATIDYFRTENADQAIYLQSTSGTVGHALFVGGRDGIYVSNSTLTISDSQFSGTANSAISADMSSSLSVSSTTISDAQRSGVSVYYGSQLNMKGVRIERAGSGAAVGVYGSRATIAESSLIDGGSYGVEVYDDPFGNISTVDITHSTLSGFSQEALYAGGHGSVGARRNWWGNPAGPSAMLYGKSKNQSAVYGNASTTPWLRRPPEVYGDSSVLFIPGIQATRLLSDSNQLWEPNRNADVEHLFLDNAGRPLATDVRIGTIIDSINSLGIGPNIYKSFMQLLDGFVAQGKIREWRPLPYDWRFAASAAADAVDVDLVRSIASSSYTGKVSFVAHSNGGLVLQHLLNRLAEKHLDLVDKVVFVGTPHVGTPQAIATILHGDNLRFAGGLILSPAVGRGLAQNSPGAIGLLPNDQYTSSFLANGTPPIVQFASTTDRISMNFFQAYGDHIDSASRLMDFLSASLDRRTPPNGGDIATPAVISRGLLTSSHPVFADQYPPADVYSVVGWGIDTLSSIVYSAKDVCQLPKVSFQQPIFTLCNLGTTLRHDPVWSRMGDGTVMTQSALAVPSSLTLNSTTYFLDLSAYNKKALRVHRNHSDLLEISSALDLITSILHTPVDSEDIQPLLPEYVSTSPPQIQNTTDRLRVTVHSPVSIDVFDSLGNHTGDFASSSPVSLYEESVPGSEYHTFGEMRYVAFDISTTSPRHLELRSAGAGLLTLEVEYLHGDTQLKKEVFSDVPITPTTVLFATFPPVGATEVFPSSFVINHSAATTTPTVEPSRLLPGRDFDATSYLLSVRQVIQEICLSERRRLSLLTRLNTVITAFEKGEMSSIRAQLRNMVIVSSNEVSNPREFLQSREAQSSYASAVELLLAQIDAVHDNR